MAPLITPRRLVMAALMRGPATRHITTSRNPKVITSQKNWLEKVVVSNGGKPPSCLGTSVVAVAGGLSIIDGRSLEQNDHRDQQAEQAGGFAQRETEQHVGILALGGAGIAQRPRQIATEHIADADAGADQRDAGEA